MDSNTTMNLEETIAKMKYRIKKYIETIEDQQLTINQGLKTVQTCEQTLTVLFKSLQDKDMEIKKLKSDNLFKQAGLDAMSKQVEKLNKRFEQFRKLLDITPSD